MSRSTRYLLTLYVLTQQRGPPLRTSAVAERLDRSSASVTEMFQRLDDDGLVTYEPYQGASLTETGRERAAALHETYVTVSWFFRDVLGLDSSEAEAIRLAEVLDPDVAERLAGEIASERAATDAFDSERSPGRPDEFSARE